MTPTPSIYLDTNVIRDVDHNRKKESIIWVEQIREKKWNCYTSVFAFMEMLDNDQEDKFVFKMREDGLEYNTICRKRNEKDLTFSELDDINHKFQNVFVKYPFVKPVTLSNSGWDLALHIAATSNIFSPDIIHLSTAWESKCDLIMTSDQHFIKHATNLLKRESVWDQLRICSPENVKQTLSDLKFRGLT